MVDPVHHYVTVGAAAGLSPHPLFDPAHYASQLGPTEQSMPLAAHYLMVGWQQGLSPHPLFDGEYYQRMSGVDDKHVCPLTHYLTRSTYDSVPHYLFSDAFYVAEIGRLLVGRYVLAFEVASVLLLFALIGAILLVQDHEATVAADGGEEAA